MAKITCYDVLRTYAIVGYKNGEPVYRNATGFTCREVSPYRWKIYDRNDAEVAHYKWSNGTIVELWNKEKQDTLKLHRAPRL